MYETFINYEWTFGSSRRVGEKSCGKGDLPDCQADFRSLDTVVSMLHRRRRPRRYVTFPICPSLQDRCTRASRAGKCYQY